MEKLTLKELWQARVRGLKAANERIMQSRREATFDELLALTESAFVPTKDAGRTANDKQEEERVRRVWAKIRRHILAGSSSTPRRT